MFVYLVIIPSDHKGYPCDFDPTSGTPPSSPRILDPSKIPKSNTEVWGKINAIITDNVGACETYRHHHY